jgi:hypothetical protein
MQRALAPIVFIFLLLPPLFAGDLSQLSSERKTPLRLSLISGDFHFDLPASEALPLLQVVLPENESLLSLSLPQGSTFFTGTRDESSQDLILRVDRPDSLELTLPDPEEGKREIQLLIKNKGALSITPAGFPRDVENNSHSLGILPTSRVRTLQFPYPSIKKRSWVLSPLGNLDSLSLNMPLAPEFPGALPREIDQILASSAPLWRNESFEIYSWTSFPDIRVWDCLNYEMQNRFFTRLSYFVEKKGYNGTLMTNGQLKDKHGWNAHDYRPEDLAAFFNRIRESDFKINPEEELLRTILIREGQLTQKDDGILIPGRGAVISISRESSPVLRQRFLTHEATHGLYFISEDYRTFVKGLWESLEEADRIMWRFFLGWYGYDPGNEDLMINEFQAYLLQQSCDEAPEYFSVRMRNLLVSYPGQKSYLSRGIGPESGVFQVWSEQIQEWIRKKWGLEAGNFSPLRKELP